MVSYAFLLSAVAPVFLVVAIGYAVRRARWLDARADESLMKLVLNVAYPALVLDYTLGSPALADWRNVAIPPLAGFLGIVAGFLVAWAVAPLLRVPNGPARRTFTLGVGVYNYGYLAIPVVQALFHDRATTGVLFVHNLGVEIAFFTVGVAIVSGSSPAGALRRLVSPTVVALVVGVALTVVGLDVHVPEAFRRLIHLLGACAIPLGLLLSGAVIRDLSRDAFLGGGVRVPLGACLLRLGLLPPLFLAAAALLPIPVELQRVLVVQGAMPAGIFPIVIARHYGGDPGVAV